MSRRYGWPDEVAARRSPQVREARFTAILAALADGHRWHPNMIGDYIQRQNFISVPSTVGHSGKRLGAGSALSPTLQAMNRRGWIGRVRRDDGLSGTAYVITATGHEELARRRAPRLVLDDDFRVHRAECSHLRLSQSVSPLKAQTAHDVLAEVDTWGTYRQEGTYIDSAPCVPRELRRALQTAQDNDA